MLKEKRKETNSQQPTANSQYIHRSSLHTKFATGIPQHQLVRANPLYLQIAVRANHLYLQAPTVLLKLQAVSGFVYLHSFQLVQSPSLPFRQSLRSFLPYELCALCGAAAGSVAGSSISTGSCSSCMPIGLYQAARKASPPARALRGGSRLRARHPSGRPCAFWFAMPTVHLLAHQNNNRAQQPIALNAERWCCSSTSCKLCVLVD